MAATSISAALASTAGNEPKPDVFASGSQWLRADFHLHTRADRTFANDPAWLEVEKEGLFTEQYVARLKAHQIKVSAITTTLIPTSIKRWRRQLNALAFSCYRA